MNHVSPHRRRVLILIGLVFLGYAALRLATAPRVIEKPRILADTTAYTRVSEVPLASIDFWAAARPPAFPLLLKIAGQHYNLTAALQLGISIAAWGLLALMTSRFLQPAWLQITGIVLVLLFSLDRHVASWDFVMLTESLSISSLALFLVASLWLLRGWHFIKVVAMFLAAALLAFTRDSNAWMLLGLAGFVAVAVIVRWLQAKAWILSVLLMAVFGLSLASANAGERWLFPLGNLIARRILPDAAALHYFESCGMPVSPALMDLSGKYANSDDQAMFSGPDLDSFRYWLQDSGRSCYIGWLIGHPLQNIETTFRHSGALIAFSTVDRFYSNRYTPLLPSLLADTLYPEQYTLWIWAVSSLAALAAIWGRRWRENALWAAFVCMNLLIFPHLFLTWHGDAMAPDRHALIVGLQLYLGGWILVLLLADLASSLRHPTMLAEHVVE
jgi:hypothetical protein